MSCQSRVKRRITFLGFELYWLEDRQAVPRVQRRTARKKLQGAVRRIKDWIKSHRHLPGKGLHQRAEPAPGRALQLLRSAG